MDYRIKLRLLIGLAVVIALGGAPGCGGPRMGRKAPPAKRQTKTPPEDKEANRINAWGPKGTRNFKNVALGSNRISLTRVVRWDGDGLPRIEDGHGKILSAAGMKLPDNKSAAAWLDLVDMQIKGAEPFDVLELRVFDHKTRQFLLAYPGVGGCEMDGDTAHLLCWGKLLPDGVDVYLKVVNFPREGTAWQLPGKAGASAEVEGRKVSVREIRSGEGRNAGSPLSGRPAITINGKPWSEKERQDTKNKLIAVFDWTGPGTGQPIYYHIWAVDKIGKRYLPEYWASLQEETPVQVFDLPRERLNYFEIRPFKDLFNSFYFEDVRLPRIAGRIFAPPPPVVIPVKGKQTSIVSERFAPFQIAGQVMRGRRGAGGVTSLDSETTISYDISGLEERQLKISLWDKWGKELPADPSSSDISVENHIARGVEVRKTPLEKIDSIKFELK